MPALGQQRISVADIETRQLLRNVAIRLDTGDTLRTAWDGAALLPDSIDYHDLTLSHPLYRNRNIKRSELADTVFLMATDKLLGEVVIYGQRLRHDIPMSLDPIDIQLQNIRPTGQVNFLGILYNAATQILRRNRDAKRAKLERRRMILDNY